MELAYDKKKIFFYVACSNTDKVKIFNANLKFIDTISISDKFEVYNSPQHHINDLMCSRWKFICFNVFS